MLRCPHSYQWTIFKFVSAEEKAREAESKRIALEARLGEDLSKDSRVSQRGYFAHFITSTGFYNESYTVSSKMLSHNWFLPCISLFLGNPEKGSRFSHDASTWCWNEEKDSWSKTEVCQTIFLNLSSYLQTHKHVEFHFHSLVFNNFTLISYFWLTTIM